MKKIAFYDAKPYDRESFDAVNDHYDIMYIESKLTSQTAVISKGCDAVCAFVNDDLDSEAIDIMYNNGVKVIAMRCAGYSNVDFKAAYKKINVVRVPAYSPHAVAEHAAALLTGLNRKIYKAYNRTRDFNFSINGLTGFDLYGKTAGIIGTGKIGQAFIEVCRGFGMKVLAYDPYPVKDADFEYTDLDTLFSQSDVISLHCPLTDENNRLIDKKAFSRMKKGVLLINTSRGALINSTDLLEALKDGTVGGAGLDVYEEEGDFFFKDCSDKIMQDDNLSLLLSKPNVLLTSHQAFLTEEALDGIARTTLSNLDAFFAGGDLPNEVCYQCETGKIEECRNNRKGRCF
ncbi:MAG: 2-hydroxyacid dehydrogenase [Oscillospiraceae bacterium]|nr:2-hydroxyacid dehydrogenase [Oscillospiraceae bacterium]